MSSLREFACARCGTRIQICGRCDRGNIYCGIVCSSLARFASLKAAGKRYQKTFAGKINNAKRQKAYRLRQKNILQNTPSQIKITHQSSPDSRCNAVLPAPKLTPDHCDFCGDFVGGFIRYWFYKGRSRSVCPAGP